ncbi:hypothetical protein [Oryzifoliimicrobium ureilyticus]|uniref:hypothetical protein n=1 Tax=Oryzifoliimicrobium ureilyticus TaxID=3113724 RepID=UPI0030765B78
MTISVQAGRVMQSNRGATSSAQSAQQQAAPLTFPAPTEGLVTTADFASQQPGAASVLENWFPTLTGARIRGGSRRVGLTADGNTIISAIKYVYGPIERLFMATATAIYDMSSPAAPPATTPAAVSGLKSGDWCTFQHTNAGTSWLVCLNGADDRRLFNGTSWGTSPAITFSDTTTMANLNFGWVFKNRQFLLKNGSLDAYYLDLNAVGGAASVFPLGGVMKKGGSLLFGCSWSVESGNGPNDYCVFVSTEGEVAVYQGSNPASASDFAVIGVYQIGRPLGKNAFIKSGGEVLIATVNGLIPLSQSFKRDLQQLSLASASRPIENEWRLAAGATGTGWTLTLWPEENLVFVAFPDNPVMSNIAFVFNALNGKWAIVKNWLATCFAAYQRSLFFGSVGGYCWQGDISGTDEGLPFQASYLTSFLPAGGFGQVKSANLAKLTLRALEQPIVQLCARANGNKAIPNFARVSVNKIGSSLWDSGLWDQALWDASASVRNIYSFRQNVRAEGDTLALGCAIVSGGTAKLFIDLDLGTLLVTTGEASS